jgi:glycosyltransferase involved in cell wall biosynthesis
MGENAGMKPKIVIALPDQLGGIASLNHNIVEHTSFRDKVDLKIILYRDTTWKTPVFGESFSWGETIRFQYSKWENRYSVLKRFAKLVGSGEGALICNDSLELEAESVYPTGKVVYNIIHDFYNLKLSIKFYNTIHFFISHSELFHQAIVSSDPTQKRYFYLPHGVFIPEYKSKTTTGKLKIAFVGRLVKAKGVLNLYEINKKLKENNVPVHWYIIGNGELKTELAEQWKNESNVSFSSPVKKTDLISLLQECHLFALPTEFEGSPVSIIEAMSCGLVPLVTDLPGGIREMVTDEVGFRIPNAQPELFAACITSLANNREKVHELSIKAFDLAKQKYNISKTADAYFSVFAGHQKQEMKRTGRVEVGSSLDKKFLPNSLVSFIRKLNNPG